MMSVPSFAEFFHALWGHAPFPWQDRLAQEVLEQGWPDLLDLPTGTGKTSSLDVALYCLARAPERLPRRTVLVVDRRIVVDQGAERSRQILDRLARADGGPLRVIADSLRTLWGADANQDPFAVAVMRGGMPRDNDWARRPDQPVLGVSTIDQVGSRLLFRGYGVSPRSASIHAGLLGNDTLILLDEVHLAVPFTQTLDAIRERFLSDAPGMPRRFAVTRMSATPGQADPAWRRFELGADDHAHTELRKRLEAKKHARMVPIKVTGDDEANKRAVLAQRAVEEVLRLREKGARVIGVVLNRVDTARLTYRLLHARSDAGAVRTVLVTGRMRAIDRDQLVREVLMPCAGPRTRSDGDRPLVVVATQCIEAGADLDFDALVSECASLDALRQRFGRLDRRGELGRTDAVVLGRSDLVAPDSSDPIYGGALANTWAWLGEIATDDVVDFGSSEMSRSLAALDSTRISGLLAPQSDAPVLLPAHLDAWAQTSPVSDFGPDVALWLHGDARPSVDVQVLWRSELALPKAEEDALVVLEGARSRIAARRPSSLEAVTVPLAAARRWLAGEPSSAIADTVAGDAEAPPFRGGAREAKGAATVVALRWRGEDSSFVSAGEIAPGDVLVVSTALGGLSAGNFDPESADVVVDLADLAQLRARGIASLLLTREALRVWALPGDLSPPSVIDDEVLSDTRERVAAWIAEWPSEPPAGARCTEDEWTRLRKSLATARSRRMRVFDYGDELLVTTLAQRGTLSVEVGDALTEDESSSFRQIEVGLRRHSEDVRRVATQFATALGFDPRLAADIGLAAWLHDVGKADRRFQRWLVGGREIAAAQEAEPLAKSALAPGSVRERALARRRAGYPDGYRHELLSLAMVERSEEALREATDRELVLHLVASHHGFCRPFAPPCEDGEKDEATLNHGGALLRAPLAHGKARLDSGVADRFWGLVSRYGWWGLAWLEAVLRLADHRASEMEAEEGRVA